MIEILTNYISREYAWLFIPVIIGAFALKWLMSIKDHYDKSASGNISSMEKAIGSELIDAYSKKYIGEKLERALFYKATGIDCDVKIRKLILEMREKTSNLLSDAAYRHAAEYFIMDENRLEMQLSAFDLVAFLMLQVSSLLMLSMGGLYGIIFLLDIFGNGILYAIDYLILSFSLFVMAVLVNWVLIDVASILIIKTEMNFANHGSRFRFRLIKKFLKATYPYSRLYK